MNKKILGKIKKISDLKEKIKTLEKEVESLEKDVEDAKNKEFSALSLAFFHEENPDKRAEIERKIKSLMLIKE